MQKTALLFGIHMHQPTDNFDEAVAKAVTLCYAPFFETMLRYPAFKFSLHCSGWLLEKIRLEYPILFEQMQMLTQKGTIEWFGGGYYEPILSAIPSQDRRGQIVKLSSYLERYFGVKPKGLWLTERVWEASLVEELHASGIEYVMVDDYHFLSNGYDKEKMNGYYTTEENGKRIDLFPIAKALRYALPFETIPKVLDTLLTYQGNTHTGAIVFDDAEKFGLWPETHQWVYEKRWLQDFVEAILAHPHIVPEHYGEYRREHRSLGLAYLDNSAYVEMGEWSLPTPQAKALQHIKHQYPSYLFKGGIWKYFLIKYHESNYLHKRMLQLSLKQALFNAKSQDALYRLQTNDGFWHGVFGGFYLPMLRDNAYRYLLSIEAQLAPAENLLEVEDIDWDGYEELKVTTSSMSMVFSALQGAQMVEFALFEKGFNWQNTIMRREEPYHEALLSTLKENTEQEKSEAIATIHTRSTRVDPLLADTLIYDSYAKNSFIEHFSDKPFTQENIRLGTFDGCSDFAHGLFVMKERGCFVRQGSLLIQTQAYPATLQKAYSFEEQKVTLTTTFQSDFQEKLYLAQEFNLHFAHPHQVTLNGEKVEEGLVLYDIDKLVIIDDFTEQKLTLHSSVKGTTLFAHILFTVSKSENGFEKMAQQINIMFTRAFYSPLREEITLKVENV